MVIRPPPKVLFVHNGSDFDGYVAYFSNAGFSASEAHGDEALDVATALQPDLIVLDFDADGPTTAQLKKHHATKHIPIVALAALTQQRRDGR